MTALAPHRERYQGAYMLSGELAKKKNLSLTEAGILAGATFGVKALCRATVAKSKKAGGCAEREEGW